MSTRDERYTISYNGEVYNFTELKNELLGHGYRFHTQTDSEVVLNAFHKWGPVVLLIQWNVCFVIWDQEKEKTLYLARDRYGVKPLYYFSNDARLLFASEIKAIRNIPPFNAILITRASLNTLRFINYFDDKTLFKNIKTFPAGYWAKVEHGKSMVLNQYSGFQFSGARLRSQ